MPAMRLTLAIVAALVPVQAHSEAASVAVAFDRDHVRPVLAEGIADRATGRAVTADDPVRVASISKLVTTLGVMRLVDAGKLDLDRDVSDYLGYPVRNPAFPDTRITLAMLLSHRSSLLDGPDLYIVPLGRTIRETLADPRVWDPAHAPGSDWFHYTNLNFPVVASVMERVTKQRFDRLIARLVLRPLKLDACFNWGDGCSGGAAARAVVLYRASGEVAKDDLKGVRPTCPVVTIEGQPCDLAGYTPGWNGALFGPQGGLRISMRDLAKVGQLLARGGKGFLSPAAMARMETPLWQLNADNGLGEDGIQSGFFCAYGLAVHRIGQPAPGCRDDLFGDGVTRIGHSGDAYGLKAGLWVDPATGRGLAFFTSAVPDGSKGAHSAFSAEEEAVVSAATGRPRTAP